ncbi:phosphopantothenoylcysteine decarboxylase isoform X4 [Vidua chalybeata]|uniref:phosphopantothenoylcysteine decarboxylase isoform X4 n=1 Tax=Vidua chalybeata TaxID=81927 RepID=UPI0023A8CFD8|nr:phosphopantothenoylcysteine decarboxylase isoform X4 [Vidua chalybeata]
MSDIWGMSQSHPIFLAASGSCRVQLDWSMEPISLPEAGIAAGNSSSVAQERFHVLVGVTGSVAALKLPLLVAELLKIPGLEVKVVTTERAKHFYNAQEIPVTLYGDEEEWQLWKGRSDPVLHIELRRWADLMVVAPLDANTLAKVANGICDNLLCLIQGGPHPSGTKSAPGRSGGLLENIQSRKSFESQEKEEEIPGCH